MSCNWLGAIILSYGSVKFAMVFNCKIRYPFTTSKGGRSSLVKVSEVEALMGLGTHCCRGDW